MNDKNAIFVTKPFLPPLDDFLPYLKDIWDSRILTNNGKYHNELENRLAEVLGVRYVSLFANGTLAIIAALQSLNIGGEVLTTPYSFVATVHSLWWNNIKPVFVDIEPETCNIDPDKLEAAITPNTTAILAVHVYGTPCNVQKIKTIADIYGIKVIYDACHAFGVEIEKQSILNFGDLSILSFHATKVYNTFEGGAIICHDEKMKRRIDFIKNFGFADEVTVIAPGINAKMNEFQAALGLVQLNYIESIISKRKKIAEKYRQQLSQIKGISLLQEQSSIKYNYSYFPIFIDENTYGCSRDELHQFFKDNNIYTRRYFYPLLSQFPTYRGLPSSSGLIIAEAISEKVLCIPIYPDLNQNDQDHIISILKQMQK